jgi:hypothetical protein
MGNDTIAATPKGGDGLSPKASFTVKETENGYIALASIHDTIKQANSNKDGYDAIRTHYFSGNSGEYVYKTLDEAVKAAQKLLGLAKTRLEEERSKVNKLLK